MSERIPLCTVVVGFKGWNSSGRLARPRTGAGVLHRKYSHRALLLLQKCSYVRAHEVSEPDVTNAASHTSYVGKMTDERQWVFGFRDSMRNFPRWIEAVSSLETAGVLDLRELSYTSDDTNAFISTSMMTWNNNGKRSQFQYPSNLINNIFPAPLKIKTRMYWNRQE